MNTKFQLWANRCLLVAGLIGLVFSVKFYLDVRHIRQEIDAVTQTTKDMNTRTDQLITTVEGVAESSLALHKITLGILNDMVPKDAGLMQGSSTQIKPADLQYIEDDAGVQSLH